VDAFGRGAGPRRVCVDGRLEREQGGERDRGQRGSADEHHDRCSQPDAGQQRLHLSSPKSLDDRGLAFLQLRRAEERGVKTHQASQTGDRHYPAQREPDLETGDRIAPGAPRRELHRPYGSQQAAGEKRDRQPKRNAGQLTYRQLVMHGRGECRQEKQDGEAEHQDIAKPLDVAEEVVNALCDRQPLAATW